MSDDKPEQPAPEYTRFEAEADWQQSVDRLLALPGRELRIFDPSLESLRLNARARVELMERFLQESRIRRIYVVAHDTEHLTRRCPRGMALLARYSHVIQVNRTHEEIRNIQDSFLVLDSQHYVRRPSANHYRGAIGLNDEAEAQAMRSRFMEIWASSFPAVSSTTAGL
jgi:hypothetical protein